MFVLVWIVSASRRTTEQPSEYRALQILVESGVWQQVTSDLPAGGAPAEFIQYTESDRVQGGQVTLNIVAMHNVDFPQNKVTLSDLKPSYDPEFKCRVVCH